LHKLTEVSVKNGYSSTYNHYRKLIYPVSLILLIFVLISSAQAKYSGVGNGEPNNPYLISDVSHILEMRDDANDLDKHFLMTADVNILGAGDNLDGSFSTAVIAPDTSTSSGFQGTTFTGVFDGNDCRITNLTVNTNGAGNDYLGLFGLVNASGKITNLGLEDVNIIGGDDSYYLGGLCGLNYAGTISNCYATGNVNGNIDTGGLVGDNGGGGKILNCYATGNVNGNANTGGLVGRDYGSDEILNCYATGNVNGNVNTGGLVGLISSFVYVLPLISDCYATGNVSGNNGHTGGLVGRFDVGGGAIVNCYATGTVDGNDYTGGLVGSMRTEGGMVNCYAAGDVNGSVIVGGLAGEVSFGRVSKCYSSGKVNGNEIFGGFVGNNSPGGTFVKCFWNSEINPDANGIGNTTNPNVIGKSTAEMQSQSTFTNVGWDFMWETANGNDDIWRLCEGEGEYPKLWWQFLLGDFVCPDGVDLLDFAVLADQWQLPELSWDIAPSGGDGIVDFLDWAVFADGWQDTTYMSDLVVFADQWLQSSAYCADIAPAPGGDGVFTMPDLIKFAENWLTGF